MRGYLFEAWKTALAALTFQAVRSLGAKALPEIALGMNPVKSGKMYASS